MPASTDTCDQFMAEFRAYLETLTFIYMDPRLRSEFSMFEIIQNTLVDAWRELERIKGLDDDGRKRRLRKMLMNNLLEKIEHCRAGKCDFRRKKSLDAAFEESSCRLKASLAAEDTSPLERLVQEEERLCLLEALANLDP
jgi:hypothetical protein